MWYFRSDSLAAEARQALNFTEYSIAGFGRPRDLFKNQALGGWQEDAHTDVIHNFVDALRAYPERGNQSSTTTVPFGITIRFITATCPISTLSGPPERLAIRRLFLVFRKLFDVIYD